MKVNAENGWAREREFVLELKRKTEVWSRSGEECGKVFCVKDTHALKSHLRAIVLASLQPSSHNSSECAGPILHWELFRSLAWRRSRSFCRLEVFPAGRVGCCGCHQGNWAQPTDLLHPFVHLLSQYPQGVFAMRVPTFGARRDVKRYSAPQIG